MATLDSLAGKRSQCCQVRCHTGSTHDDGELAGILDAHELETSTNATMDSRGAANRPDSHRHVELAMHAAFRTAPDHQWFVGPGHGCKRMRSSFD